jgi:hypothetical protein
MKSSQQTLLIEDEEGNCTVEVRDVCKETPGKESKKGRFHITSINGGELQCFDINDYRVKDSPNLLEQFCLNGELTKKVDNINEIRQRINEWRNFYNF